MHISTPNSGFNVRRVPTTKLLPQHKLPNLLHHAVALVGQIILQIMRCFAVSWRPLTFRPVADSVLDGWHKGSKKVVKNQWHDYFRTLHVSKSHEDEKYFQLT